jgi:hypothetical protein
MLETVDEVLKICCMYITRHKNKYIGEVRTKK